MSGRIFDIFPLGATWWKSKKQQEEDEDGGGHPVYMRPYDLWEVWQYKEEESLLLALAMAMMNE